MVPPIQIAGPHGAMLLPQPRRLLGAGGVGDQGAWISDAFDTMDAVAAELRGAAGGGDG